MREKLKYNTNHILRTNSTIQYVWCHSEIVRILYYLLCNRREQYISKFVDQKKIGDRKYRKHLKKDMFFCLLKYGALYNEYFLYQFESKDKKYRNDFITENKRYIYYNKLNIQKNKILFDDKWKTYRRFGQYYKREVIRVRNQNDLETFCKFVSRYPVCIFKPLSAALGEGVSVMHIKEINNIKRLFRELLKKAPFIMEEIIVQNNHMSEFHPQSVNTVRVTTILTGNETTGYEVHLFCPYFRMGQSGSVVDNAGAGGIFAGIDPQTGIVITIGVDEMNNKYTHHPDTGVTIEGFQIPRWEEAVNLAEKLAFMIPANRYIGWDFALTDHGWVLVEGNASAQFNLHQICDLKGRRSELDDLCKLI